jgi:hypothetical protein
MTEPRNIPTVILFTATAAYLALMDFGAGMGWHYAVMGLNGVGQVAFAVWALSQPGPKRPQINRVLLGFGLLAAAVAVVYYYPESLPLMVILVFWHLAELAAEANWPENPKEEWPPEQDGFDTLLPRPSPATTPIWVAVGVYVLGVTSLFASVLVVAVVVAVVFAVLFAVRGFFVARHVNWRPMPIWRPQPFWRFMPFGVAVLLSNATRFGSTEPAFGWFASFVLLFLLPPIFFAASNLGENLGRRWMARR